MIVEIIVEFIFNMIVKIILESIFTLNPSDLFSYAFVLLITAGVRYKRQHLVGYNL